MVEKREFQGAGDMEKREFDSLASKLDGVEEPKKSFLLSLLKDYCWLDSQIEDLRKYPRYLINPNDPRKQMKLPVHDLLKDYQAQKDDIATKILRSLDGRDTEESPLAKALERYGAE